MPRVAFLILDPGISGGVNVVFHHAMALARRRITTAIICSKPITATSLQWHPILEMFDDPHLLWLDYHQASEHQFDIAIATWWRTFFDLWKIKADHYAYFVQSIESRFYPKDERIVRRAVDATYEAPVGFITEARWIRDYLHRMHEQTAELALNGVDKSIFKLQGDVAAPRVSGRLRVLVEGPVDVDFKNVPASIRLAREGNADEVWLLTSSDVSQITGVDRVFSRIPQKQTAAIYRSCDVLLKLSLVEGMFGPPLEMFHCGGTSIVYDVTGHDEYITHGKNALVARMHDEASVRRYITQLKEVPELLAGLKVGAIATAAEWPGWPESTRQFQLAIENLATRPTVNRSTLGIYSRRIWRMVEDHWIKMTELQHRLAKSETERAHIEAERAHIHKLLTNTYRSSSWRVTRPARVAKRILSERGYARYIFNAAIRNARRALKM